MVHLDDDDKKYCYQYPHAAVTADCVIFGFDGRTLKILLIERGNAPYLGHWALPGGFMRIDETIEETAERELQEETNLRGVYMEQFKVYSEVDRDPRERVITVAFIALVRPEKYRVIAGDDADKAYWFNENQLPPLAFDHRRIIREAREHLKEILRIKPIAFQLLSKSFSISELQKVYEVINGTEYDRRNFQRSVLEANIIVENSDEPAGSRSQKSYSLGNGEEDLDARDVVMEAPMPMCCEACAPDEGADFEEKCMTKNSARNMKPRKRGGSTKGLFDFFKW